MPFHRPLARMGLNALVGIYNLQFSVTLFPGWGGREGTKRKKKKKKAKRRKYNFKFIDDLPVPSLWLQRNFNPAARWPGCWMLQTTWAVLTPPLLAASRPHSAATQPGIWLISATGQDITGLLRHTGGCTQKESFSPERLTPVPTQTKFSGAKVKQNRFEICVFSTSAPFSFIQCLPFERL